MAVCLAAVVQHPCDMNPLSEVATLAAMGGPRHFLYFPASTSFRRGDYFGMLIGEAECVRWYVRGGGD